MKVIHKYHLSAVGYQSIAMPKGAKVLSAQVQNGEIFVWAEVDTDEDNELRDFKLIGTGHEIISSNLRFIDTVQLSSGQLILHVHEVLQDDAK